MGLFNFGKKKEAPKKAPTQQSTGISNAQSFYTDCVTDFHNEAAKYGVATKGMIFIPELLPLGQKTVLAYLQDSFFQMQFGNNPQMYYYFIFSLSVDAGMCFAAKWHEDFAGLNRYVDRIIEEGAADEANLLMQRHLPKALFANQGNEFFQKIFPRWLAMHDPYWKLKDPREYTFNAMLAGYQLGVSIILEKLGY